MEKEIINRVEKSDLIQINLDDYYPEGDRVIFDLKEQLFEGIALIEKDFRTFIKDNDWSVYKDKYVGITCSADAIIPQWAFMLLASNIELYARKVILGNKVELEKAIFAELLSNVDFSSFLDKNVILKGCGNMPIPESVFIDFTVKLQGFAKNIMFGEACSAVPIFKKPK